MAELPTGTLTFLLTDVEGSTALWENAHGAMHAALARHDAIIADSVVGHGGIALKQRREGDSTFAVFQSALAAATAALSIHQTLADEPWPTPRPIRVRIALHSGDAQLRDGDYYGSTVNRCARLRGIGHGGQTLLSEATAALVRDHLPDGALLIDLGEHRLKDLARPEHVFQLTADGLRTRFPPLASLSAHRHNLPVAPTPLIGRRHEIRALHDLLAGGGARLVTLSGPGGIGKTRLGLQVAAELLHLYEDGAYFIDLAQLLDPALVLPTIVATLGIQDPGGRPILDVLVDYLRGRHMLLVLDNFEQVIAAATGVDALLRACPRLTLLVTSRAPLQLRSERDVPVTPLALPEAAGDVSPDALTQYDAVALFIERAVAVQPGFAVTNANAQAVAEICTRLDGLPLAIELAAARMRLLSPALMLSRLGHGLGLLTGGRRDLPARQQTLRNAIAWSYDLLTEAEQRLFWRIGVFVGGFTLEAAEAICDHQGDLGISVLDGLESLAASSLLRRDADSSREGRFTMLETIREFSVDRLEASGENADLRQRHLLWCLERVEEATRAAGGPAWGTWLDWLETEHDNVRAALTWNERSDGDPELGLRLARAMTGFWLLRCHHYDGRTWLARMLARMPVRNRLRAAALCNAGFLAVRQNDYAAACPYFEEALSISRDLSDTHMLAQTLLRYGVVPHHQGNYEKARTMLQESLALFRQIDNAMGVAAALQYLGDLHRDLGDHARASTAYQDSLTLVREHENAHGIAYSLRGLGHVARARGEYDRARGLLRESLSLLKGLRDRRCIPLCLEGLACIAVGPDWAERAARLFGAAHATQESTGAPASPSEMADYQRTAADARTALGDSQFAAAWGAGAAMSLDEAVTYALSEDAPVVTPEASTTVDLVGPSFQGQPERAITGPATSRGRSPQSHVLLSAREREVVALIADGLSNRQIAARLVLSVRTVERHIENVYNRLGIRGKAGRAIVTAYALRHQLVEGA